MELLNIKRFIMLILLSLTINCFSQNTIVKTQNGLIKGVLKDDVSVFYGIPYAAPPVGDLRWKAPQELKNWDGVKDCNQFAPSAFQADPVPFMYWSQEYLIPKEPISEDCLYLNVWTKNEPEIKKPVLVYIHGGGFRSGGSACPIYDGFEMAQNDVVVVTINYRLGLFGFMAHPELRKESPNNSSGNYGILDMIAALKWVQNNIQKFGGDPNQVTIAGQSAGSMAVNVLCATPLAKGLFKRAIAESGAGVLSNFIRPSIALDEAENTGLELQHELAVSSVEELRKLSPNKLLSATKGLNVPYVDGYVLPKSIQEIYESGEQNMVDLLMGWNKDDVVGRPSKDRVTYIQNLKSNYGNSAAILLENYPAENDEQWLNSQKRLSADEIFGVQHYYWAKLVNAKGLSDVFMYRFYKHTPSYDPNIDFGSFHSSEIVYAYHNLKTSDRPWNKEDYQLSNLMSTYWAQFIKSGNPNGVNELYWPAYQQDSKQVMLFDTISKVVRFPNEMALDMMLKNNLQQ